MPVSFFMTAIQPNMLGAQMRWGTDVGANTNYHFAGRTYRGIARRPDRAGHWVWADRGYWHWYCWRADRSLVVTAPSYPSWQQPSGRNRLRDNWSASASSDPSADLPTRTMVT